MLLEANIRKMLVNGDQWACLSGYHIPVSEDYFVIWTPIRYGDALEARNMDLPITPVNLLLVE